MLKTTDGKLLEIEELAWEDAAQLLQGASPDLVKVINNTPNAQRYPFYKASYRFGDHIIDKQGLHLPLNRGGTILGKDKRLPETLQENLGCALEVSCPIGIILNKKCEFYIQNSEKITPYTVLKPGDIFGVSKNMSEDDEPVAKFWDLVAGGRSIFMLSKISNNPQYTHLKRKYNLISRVPTKYSEQWVVFKEIALKANSDWRAEILFFDNRLAHALKVDNNYAALKAQLLAAISSNIWHHQPNWDVSFGKIEVANNLIAYPADILNTARHLFSIVAGLYPGFIPSTDEMLAPIRLLQDVYSNIYELEHAAIIIEPVTMDINYKLPIYYSINLPTSPKSVPKSMDNKKSIVSNLANLREIMESYQESLIKQTEIKVSSLRQMSSRAKFLFYDNEYEKYSGIKNIAILPDEDSRFACNDKTFPIHSAFLKGLVKITNTGF